MKTRTDILLQEVADVLEHNILDYWLDVRGLEGVILNARYVWAFSAAYSALFRSEYLIAARDACDRFLAQYADPVNGGVYWNVAPDGTPSDGDDDCQPMKNPHYYNYLSPQACRRVENYLRMRFNLEFHEVMMENEDQGRPLRHLDVVRRFLHRHRLTAISEDALLKNFRRFRHRVYPKKVRTYRKTARNKKV